MLLLYCWIVSLRCCQWLRVCGPADSKGNSTPGACMRCVRRLMLEGLIVCPACTLQAVHQLDMRPLVWHQHMRPSVWPQYC